jgi:hypothetical protein
LVYILAASHSGSTLLTMLLNSHPDVGTVGELAPGHMEDLAFYRCSCGRNIRECPFWEQIGNAVRARGVDFSLESFPTPFAVPESRIATRLLRPLHRGPALEAVRDAGLRLLTPWPRRSAEAVRANEAVVRAVLDYYGAHVFVDKGNKALRLKFLLQIPAFNVKVIHLVRDGRAVALTYMDPAGYADARDKALRGGGSGGDRASEGLSIAAAAHQWRRCIEEAEYALARIPPSQWIRVCYEDLCTDTDAELARIFGFLGLDPTGRGAGFRSVEHHVVGNGMRLDSTGEVSLDERWKDRLGPTDLAAFDAVAGPLNHRNGYVPA